MSKPGPKAKSKLRKPRYSAKGKVSGLVALQRGDLTNLKDFVYEAAGIRDDGAAGTTWLDPNAKRRWKKPRRVDLRGFEPPGKWGTPYVNPQAQLCDRDGTLLADGLALVPPLAHTDGKTVLTRDGKRI